LVSSSEVGPDRPEPSTGVIAWLSSTEGWAWWRKPHNLPASQTGLASTQRPRCRFSTCRAQWNRRPRWRLKDAHRDDNHHAGASRAKIRYRRPGSTAHDRLDPSRRLPRRRPVPAHRGAESCPGEAPMCAARLLVRMGLRRRVFTRRVYQRVYHRDDIWAWRHSKLDRSRAIRDSCDLRPKWLHCLA
jgi:hypothetical protein